MLAYFKQALKISKINIMRNVLQLLQTLHAEGNNRQNNRHALTVNRLPTVTVIGSGNLKATASVRVGIQLTQKCFIRY